MAHQRISFDEILNTFDDFDDMMGSAVYVNYCFNRDRRPDITPQQWELVYGEKTKDMEFLYQKERQL